MGRVAEPPRPGEGSNPGSPQVLLPQPHSGPYPRTELGVGGGAGRAKWQQGYELASDNDQDGVADSSYNMESNSQCLGAKGTSDTGQGSGSTWPEPRTNPSRCSEPDLQSECP